MSAVAPLLYFSAKPARFGSGTPVVSEHAADTRSFDPIKRQDFNSIIADLADVVRHAETQLSENTIAQSTDWLQKIFDIAINIGGWQPPHMSSTADGEIVCEWWKGERKLTMYLKDNWAEYIKVWGPDMDSEMESGILNRWSFLSAWLWLNS